MAIRSTHREPEKKPYRVSLTVTVDMTLTADEARYLREKARALPVGVDRIELRPVTRSRKSAK